MSHGTPQKTMIWRLMNYTIETCNWYQAAGKNKSIVLSDTPSWPHQLLVCICPFILQIDSAPMPSEAHAWWALKWNKHFPLPYVNNWVITSILSLKYSLCYRVSGKHICWFIPIWYLLVWIAAFVSLCSFTGHWSLTLSSLADRFGVHRGNIVQSMWTHY